MDIYLIETDCNCGFRKVFSLPNNLSKLIYVVKLRKFLAQELFHKEVEHGHPGEHSPE